MDHHWAMVLIGYKRAHQPRHNMLKTFSRLIRAFIKIRRLLLQDGVERSCCRGNKRPRRHMIAIALTREVITEMLNDCRPHQSPEIALGTTFDQPDKREKSDHFQRVNVGTCRRRTRFARRVPIGVEIAVLRYIGGANRGGHFIRLT